MMKYIVVASRLTEYYYLNKKGEFVEIPRGADTRKILNDATSFSNYYEAEYFCEGKNFYVNNNEVKRVNEGYTLGDYTLSIWSVRLQKPTNIYFEEEDVRRAIANGKESGVQTLSVTLNGDVVLVERDGVNQIRNYACTNGESFSSGIVGIEASNDDEFIRNEYMRLLEAWKHHILSFGRFSTGNDYYIKLDIEACKQEIENFVTKYYS